MERKLREYIEELFEGAPQTRRALELKDEMSQNLIDRYRDLTQQGKNEEDAYNIAVASIGDVNVLLRDIEDNENPVDRMAHTRSAVLTSIAVMLYILSVIPLFILQNEGGVVVMFIIAAIATGLIIYGSMTKPKYRRADDSVVEEFKEWQSRGDEKDSIYKAVKSAIWSITLAIYFLVSFTTGAWYITWIVFIMGTAVTQIAKVFIELRR